MKRFYETVSVAAAEHGTAFRIDLDARPVKTPARRELRVPSRSLAEAIAEEWRAQEDNIVLATMVLTRLAGAAIDRVADRRTAVVDETAAYAETDMLCYRADHPEALAERQHKAWQPILDWMAERHDASFAVTAGVIPVSQPPATINAVKAAITAHDDMRLAALHSVTHAAGSVILALALVEGRLDADATIAASELDEQFQNEQWGEDAEAAERRAERAKEINACARFVALLRVSG